MKQQLLRGLIWSILILLPLSAFAQPIDIGSRRELFVDQLLIDKLQGVELKLHTPVKAPRPRSPLPVRHMMTVIKNGDRYQAYWRGSDPDYRVPMFGRGSRPRGERVGRARPLPAHTVRQKTSGETRNID